MEKLSDDVLKTMIKEAKTNPYAEYSREYVGNICADLLSTRKELEQFYGAMGYITGLAPDVMVDIDNPYKMAVEISKSVKTSLSDLRADAETSQNHNAAVIDPLIAQLRDAGYTGTLSEMVGQACELQGKVKELSGIVSERHGDNDFYEAPINENDNSADETIKMIFNILDADPLPVPPKGGE